jgi:hypothetical protein
VSWRERWRWLLFRLRLRPYYVSDPEWLGARGIRVELFSEPFYPNGVPPPGGWRVVSINGCEIVCEWVDA